MTDIKITPGKMASPEMFYGYLGFDPDQFQQDAMNTIHDGHSVVVCAPTGSGKTLVAEYAAYQALHDGKRLFYTTPLKALSNQKYHDFKRQYGEDNVGLLTGDLSLNRDARIVVMTTEIFRNMLYGIQIDPDYLKSVGYVVLDECHYMNDSQRGTVWEESIIYCPGHIQVIALSATVANAQELTDWINQVHHDTTLVESDYRPVPLRFSFYDREHMMPLFDAPGKLNKKLKTVQKGNRFAKHQRVFKLAKLLEVLHERDMLPAIFFSFSRKDCDNYLRETREMSLLNKTERAQIEQYIDDFVEQNPYLKNNPQLPLIANGFASHHAGLLPGIKFLVESLFQRGLIKVVFATETLAAGINMPARTTIISKISKRGDEGHRLLTANEFLQMSGRAGRRGMDPVGYVVVLSSQYEGAREAAQLASSSSDPLNSQFTPTYGMVLNLLQRHSLEQSEYLIRRSFGQFTSARRLKPVEDEINEKTEKLSEALGFECPAGLTTSEFHSYLKGTAKLHETQHFIKLLKKQIKQHGASPEILQQLSKEDGKKNSLQGTLQTTACYTCDLFHKHNRLEDKVTRLQKQLKQLNRVYNEEKDGYWQNFLNIQRVLKNAGYLDDLDIPTAKGKITAQLRAENEYMMAESIFRGQLDDLSPDQLAAVVCALVNDTNKMNQFCKFEYSAEVHYAFEELHKLARTIHKEQEKCRVHTNIYLNPVSSGLIQAWAQGVTWDRLVSSTNIAEGDIVRIVRRTADMLRQIMRISFDNEDQKALVSPMLINNAKLALDKIDRAPVKEVEIVEVSEEQAAEAEVAPASDLKLVVAPPEPGHIEIASEPTIPEA